MDIQTLKAFFMWCTIVNMGLLILTSLILLAGRDMVYRVHSKWFPMSREAHNIVLYSFIGFYKILIFVFCIVPYVALLIIA